MKVMEPEELESDVSHSGDIVASAEATLSAKCGNVDNGMDIW